MLSLCIDMAERERKILTFRLDELVTQAIKEQSLEEGISTNKWLENHLFDYFKNIGKIPKNIGRIPENRGGDRKSKRFLEEND